jgi:hypothetical protein
MRDSFNETSKPSIYIFDTPQQTPVPRQPANGRQRRKITGRIASNTRDGLMHHFCKLRYAKQFRLKNGYISHIV